MKVSYGAFIWMIEAMNQKRQPFVTEKEKWKEIIDDSCKAIKYNKMFQWNKC